MELKKLQTLAEGKNRGEAEARSMFDSMEGSLGSLELWFKTGRLADFLKRHHFPATESKAFENAFKSLYGEFEDLKQGVITGIEEHNMSPEDFDKEDAARKPPAHALDSTTRNMFKGRKQTRNMSPKK